MGRLRPNRPSDHVASYLARGENVVMEMKQHWARLLPAISSCLLGLFLVIIAGAFAPAWMGPVTNAAWWIWLVLVVHLLWRILEWHDETFVITNKRLILVHGLVIKKVAMMPLSKVTDMSYNRAPAARLLGYGTFKIESAGQDQALNVIDYVRDPDEKYRDICGLIFGMDDDDAPHRSGHDWDDEGWSDDGWDRDDGDQDGGDREDRRGANRDESRPFDVDAHGPRYHGDSDDTDPFGYDVPRRSHAHGAPPYSGVEAEDDGAGDAPAWTVSREHATAPQRISRNARSRTSGRSSTWRDDE